VTRGSEIKEKGWFEGKKIRLGELALLWKRGSGVVEGGNRVRSVSGGERGRGLLSGLG